MGCCIEFRSALSYPGHPPSVPVRAWVLPNKKIIKNKNLTIHHYSVHNINMTDIQTLLKMIETVDPSDTAKLDEIDARTHCYFTNRTFVQIREEDIFGVPTLMVVTKIYSRNTFMEQFKKYTRSRDALKAIRPEGWFPQTSRSAGGNSDGFQGIAGKMEKKKHLTTEFTPLLPTEELAELHAILQTIHYERTTP